VSLDELNKVDFWGFVEPITSLLFLLEKPQKGSEACMFIQLSFDRFNLA
jgi:hypothetical protein